MPRPLLLLAVAALLVACARTGGRTLSFAQMQSMNPGVSGDWMLQEFPFADRVSRWPDGKVRELTYGVTDPNGKARRVTMVFDNQGVMTEKRYTGAYVRPAKTENPKR
jgi:hypothetical protein